MFFPLLTNHSNAAAIPCSIEGNSAYTCESAAECPADPPHFLDNGDNDKASFVQRGLLSVSNIYRSHKDLISSSDNDAINKMKLPTVK